VEPTFRILVPVVPDIPVGRIEASITATWPADLTPALWADHTGTCTFYSARRGEPVPAHLRQILSFWKTGIVGATVYTDDWRIIPTTVRLGGSPGTSAVVAPARKVVTQAA